MLISAALFPATSSDRPVSEAGGALDFGINRIPPGTSFRLMCQTSVVQLLARVRQDAADK